MTSFHSPLSSLAYAVRMGDLSAAEVALDDLAVDSPMAVLRGKAAADKERRRDPPLPPLPVDNLQLVAAERARSTGPFFPSSYDKAKAPKRKGRAA